MICPIWGSDTTPLNRIGTTNQLNSRGDLIVKGFALLVKRFGGWLWLAGWLAAWLAVDGQTVAAQTVAALARDLPPNTKIGIPTARGGGGGVLGRTGG